MNNKIKNMALFAMLVAIEVVLFVTPLGLIPLGFLNITTMHIPVIICGIVLGRKYGAALGFIFGLLSLIKNTMAPGAASFVFSPFIQLGTTPRDFMSIMSTLLITFVPRTLIGYISGLIYDVLGKKNDNVAIIASGLVGSLTNTVLVLSGIYFLLGPDYAQALGKSYDVLSTLLLTTVFTNGIGEAVAAVVISLIVCRALKSSLKKFR